MYEGESVDTSQMDIERKAFVIQTWKKTFLDISSTNIDTLVPSLYHCVETRSTEVFRVFLSHFCTWLGIICDSETSSRELLDPVVNPFTRQTLPTVNRKHFFVNILCI
jgi:spore maturation protein SpmA